MNLSFTQRSGEKDEEPGSYFIIYFSLASELCRILMSYRLVQHHILFVSIIFCKKEECRPRIPS